MNVLVTGSNGMLGRDLCPLLDDRGYETIEAARCDFDITDFSAAEKFIEKNMPEILIHCAAYTNVDRAEEEEASAAHKRIERTTETEGKYVRLTPKRKKRIRNFAIGVTVGVVLATLITILLVMLL